MGERIRGENDNKRKEALNYVNRKGLSQKCEHEEEMRLSLVLM